MYVLLNMSFITTIIGQLTVCPKALQSQLYAQYLLLMCMTCVLPPHFSRLVTDISLAKLI